MTNKWTGFCFHNGAIAVCGEDGKQIPSLQRGWPVLWAEHAKREGYDPVGAIFETPSGKIRICDNGDGGFNWEILP